MPLNANGRFTPERNAGKYAGKNAVLNEYLLFACILPYICRP